jgi:hypothetical protein
MARASKAIAKTTTYGFGDFCTLKGAIYGDVVNSDKWYIYIHKKRSNGDVFYVGLGRYNRCNQINQRSNYWKSVFDKHGRSIEIIYNGLTKDEAIQHEISLIDKYKNEGVRLCNLTNGGDTSSSDRKRAVYLYKKSTGEFVKYFSSISQLNCYLHMSTSNSKISQCIDLSNRSYKGYCFSSTKRDEFIYKKNNVHNSKAIFQYNIDGSFVKEWESLSSVDFIKHHSSISNCLDKDLTGGGFFWRTIYEDVISVKEIKPALKKRRSIFCIFDSKVYDSISSAIRLTAYTKKKIQIELKKPNGFFKSYTHAE